MSYPAEQRTGASPAAMPLAAINAIPVDECVSVLRTCCDSPVWARAVAVGRPYATLPELLSLSANALSSLSDDETKLAARTHPRIGRTPAGLGEHAAWSRREQQVASGDRGLALALEEENDRYERRFGHRFIVNALGLTAQQILDRLRQRMAQDPASELATVRSELGAITSRRLGELVR